jgi:hypothetical protein
VQTTNSFHWYMNTVASLLFIGATFMIFIYFFSSYL